MKVMSLIICSTMMLMLSAIVYAQPKNMFESKVKELAISTDDDTQFKVKIETMKPPKNYVYTKGWRWGSEQSTPKYIIRNIRAWWGSEEIFIPLSAYVDLSNPNDLRLKKGGSEIHLIVKGGDAGNSYEALIIFAKGLLRSKKVVHGEFPNEAWEETRYSFNELDN